MSARQLIIVTGLSGAGKSTAIHALEDLGYFCVDNLPPPLVGPSLEAFERGGVNRIALGMDVRVRHFLDEIGAVIDALPEGTVQLRIVFLDASDDALLRRFSSTRRPHPLSVNDDAGAGAVLEGIRTERALLSGLRARASVVVDTTRLSVHDLRRQLVAMFSQDDAALSMRTRVVSFGFKYGVPVDADLVFDVRFLKNPYFIEALRPLSGLDDAIRQYVLEQADAQELVEHLRRLLVFLVPRFADEGKAYLTVAVGCTGGRHRSVALAEQLRSLLEKDLSVPIDVTHRDVNRVKDKLGLSGVESLSPQKDLSPQMDEGES